MTMVIHRFMKIRLLPGMRCHIKKYSVDNRGVQFLFKKNLLMTNSLTSGLCMFVGDLIQQEFEYQSEKKPMRYDWKRLGRMCLVGILVGPLHHYYYIYLDKMIPKVTIKTAFIKIAYDQFIASPINLVVFYSLLNMLEGKTLHDFTEEIKNKFLYTYAADCLFWPPIQFINFYYLPTHYRVVYINAATTIFNVFLSYMKHFDQTHV